MNRVNKDMCKVEGKRENKKKSIKCPIEGTPPHSSRERKRKTERERERKGERKRKIIKRRTEAPTILA